MRARLVIPPHPVSNDTPCLIKRLEHVGQDAFLLETAKESFDDPILFWCVRRNELLLQPIVPTVSFPVKETLLKENFRLQTELDTWLAADPPARHEAAPRCNSVTIRP